MAATRTRQRRAQANGRPDGDVKVEATPEQMEAARGWLEALEAEAADIRGDALELDAALYLKLARLARRPIPEGFLQYVPKLEKGKPYPSTGIRSLQVQIDIMDAIFTALWWGWSTHWLNDAGTLAEVTVWIGTQETPFVRRKARGGVDRGSTQGNVFKGTETNAAKLAIARIGPGHEVYLGAADFDPDTDASAAEEQAKAPRQAAPLDVIDADAAAHLRDAFDAVPGDAKAKAKKLKTWLGAHGVSGVGSVNQALAKLTPALAAELDGTLSEWKDAGE